MLWNFISGMRLIKYCFIRSPPFSDYEDDYNAWSYGKNLIIEYHSKK